MAKAYRRGSVVSSGELALPVWHSKPQKVWDQGLDAVAGLYPTAKEARIICAIVNAAAVPT